MRITRAGFGRRKTNAQLFVLAAACNTLPFTFAVLGTLHGGAT
jgi:hypothetical protein